MLMNRNEEEDFDFPIVPIVRKWGAFLEYDEDWNSHTKKDNTKTAYDYLKEFKEVRNFYSSNTPILSPYTNRVNYIVDELNKLNVQYQLDIFNTSSYTTTFSNNISYSNTIPSLVNIVVEINSHLKTTPAIVFCAHHDVNNTKSENCQDNSASVCNLLYLVSLLKKEENLNKRIIVLFTDCEEFGGKGAARFSQKATHSSKPYGDIQYIVNLELTGLGDSLWIDTGNVSDKTSFGKSELIKAINESNALYKDVYTPFSDAIVFRRFNLDSFCFGILPLEELNTNKKTWSLCHSTSDTIDKISEEDMNDFVKLFLLPFSLGKELGQKYLK